MRKFIIRLSIVLPFFIFFQFAYSNLLEAQPYSVTIGKLKYDGGGDWYSNPTALPNLCEFIRKQTQVNIASEEEIVEPSSPLIFQFPMLYLTGHGNIEFSRTDADNLRNYLLSGGFLLIDDNYGMNKYAIREIKKVFPDKKFVDIPFSHPIFRNHFVFPNGIPKIHEHDNKPAQALGIFHEGRLVCMLTFESDLGDGWENPEVHNDSPEVRLKALQMGANVLIYALIK